MPRCSHVCKSPQIRVLPCVSSRAHVHTCCQCVCTLTCECWWGFASHACVLARVRVHSHTCAAVCTWLAHTCACTSPCARPHVPHRTRVCTAAQVPTTAQRGWGCTRAACARGLSTGPRVRMAAMHEGCARTGSTRARGPRQHKDCACTRPTRAQSPACTRKHTWTCTRAVNARGPTRA